MYYKTIGNNDDFEELFIKLNVWVRNVYVIEFPVCYYLQAGSTLVIQEISQNA